MASQSQGIQQLLQAEKRAAEKVSEARKREFRGKNRRLKQAKEEAQAEIEQYRLQREKEFKAKEAARLHSACLRSEPSPLSAPRASCSPGGGPDLRFASGWVAFPGLALGSHGSCSTEVEKETQEKMTILQAYFQQNRDEVLDNLLAFVCDIRPEIHENYRING
ncbi:hypothetical protein GH733_011294 [Mirounga leonina]|nr:hypothetical protein GH733_011294 [Mirounga leonina]